MKEEIEQHLLSMIEDVIAGKTKKMEVEWDGAGRISVYRAGTVIRCDIQSNAENPEMV